MTSQRTHYGKASDGVRIGGTVHGEGPPIVFWHGAYGDGDLDWRGLLPHLVDRFTCHLPSWRGRGLSEESLDLSYERRVEDVLTYLDSVGEPVGLVGWSGGASPAVAAAAQSAAVFGVALLEPTMGTVMDEQDRMVFGGSVGGMRELAAEERFADALRAAAAFPFSDREIATADSVGYFEAASHYVPNLLNVFTQLMEYRGPMADDPAVLGEVSAPVLVLRGSDTKPFWIRSAEHVAEHVPNASIQEIHGAGHAAPLTHPDDLSDALVAFFATPQNPNY